MPLILLLLRMFSLQTNRQAGRQIDRQINRQTYIYTYILTDINNNYKAFSTVRRKEDDQG